MDYAMSIRRTLENATATDWTEGTAWYRTARGTAEELAERYGVDVDTAARTIAVLSPRVRWATNVEWAERVLHAAHTGQECPKVGMTANRDKAWRIAHGDPTALRGQKVERFHANIMGDDASVTVDVWALRAAGITDHDAPTTIEYREIADAYRLVAAEHGVPASALQAVAWIVIRGSGN